ncbi:hypothetical protein PoB_003971200 [Plakobranchus ocellatus]|uniref:Uncharacterized protein n=1 Tax=Plakobranchus ocellatus TaxID=259542 RepID=A0AAV4B105_9GAST|nr:hypothetical protein PoB_003971200 [Plakobranchus ocellatus]
MDPMLAPNIMERRSRALIALGIRHYEARRGRSILGTCQPDLTCTLQFCPKFGSAATSRSGPSTFSLACLQYPQPLVGRGTLHALSAQRLARCAPHIASRSRELARLRGHSVSRVEQKTWDGQFSIMIGTVSLRSFITLCLRHQQNDCDRAGITSEQ